MSLAFIHLPENEYAPLARGLSALSRQHGSAKLAFPCAYHLHIHSHSTLPQHSFPRTHVGTNSSAEFTHLARCKETLGNSQPTCPARTLHRAERATISKSVNQPSRAHTHTHTQSFKRAYKSDKGQRRTSAVNNQYEQHHHRLESADGAFSDGSALPGSRGPVFVFVCVCSCCHVPDDLMSHIPIASE